MAAAAMTPRSFETFLSPASFPGVSFISPSDECVKAPPIVNHACGNNRLTDRQRRIDNNLKKGRDDRRGRWFLLFPQQSECRDVVVSRWNLHELLSRLENVHAEVLGRVESGALKGFLHPLQPKFLAAKFSFDN